MPICVSQLERLVIVRLSVFDILADRPTDWLVQLGGATKNLERIQSALSGAMFIERIPNSRLNFNQQKLINGGYIK